jgi:hypothetical protein
MAVTNYKYPGTASGWTDNNNIKADDNSVAYAITPDSKTNTAALLASNFGFTSSDIPSGSTINGIEFIIEKKGDAVNETYDINVYLKLNGSNVSSNLASAVKWATSLTTTTYGGSSDLCGWSSVTQGNILDSTFQISLVAKNTLSAENFYVDYIKIRVYYTEGGGATVKPHYYYLQQ